MENNDTCKNCIFFKPHYAENDDGELYMLEIGHCENPHIHTMQFKRSLKYKAACLYRQAAEQTEKSKERLTDIIKNMAARIEQIAAHLNIEKR